MNSEIKTRFKRFKHPPVERVIKYFLMRASVSGFHIVPCRLDIRPALVRSMTSKSKGRTKKDAEGQSASRTVDASDQLCFKPLKRFTSVSICRQVMKLCNRPSLDLGGRALRSKMVDPSTLCEAPMLAREMANGTARSEAETRNREFLIEVVYPGRM